MQSGGSAGGGTRWTSLASPHGDGCREKRHVNVDRKVGSSKMVRPEARGGNVRRMMDGEDGSGRELAMCCSEVSYRVSALWEPGNVIRRRHKEDTGARR